MLVVGLGSSESICDYVIQRTRGRADRCWELDDVQALSWLILSLAMFTTVMNVNDKKKYVAFRLYKISHLFSAARSDGSAAVRIRLRFPRPGRRPEGGRQSGSDPDTRHDRQPGSSRTESAMSSPHAGGEVVLQLGQLMLPVLSCQPVRCSQHVGLGLENICCHAALQIFSTSWDLIGHCHRCATSGIW